MTKAHCGMMILICINMVNSLSVNGISLRQLNTSQHKAPSGVFLLGGECLLWVESTKIQRLLQGNFSASVIYPAHFDEEKYNKFDKQAFEDVNAIAEKIGINKIDVQIELNHLRLTKHNELSGSYEEWKSFCHY